MKLKEHLNPSQTKAAEHIKGPILVIAGAGSGKTRTVTYRIAHLLDLGVPSSEILAVTFTNKAAGEMRHRVHTLSQKNILCSTFHSLGARILRTSITPLGYTPHFAIFDEEDSEKILKECLEEQGLKEEKGRLKEMRIGIAGAKNQLLSPEELFSDEPLLKVTYSLYQNKLKTCNALDFDDLLFLTVKLFQEEPEILKRYQNTWSFILIDEYQDINEAQHVLVKQLSHFHHNVFAVGDPDQSIYSWRGANIQNILRFEQDYPESKVVRLEQNYRSTQNILNAANALIDHNQRNYQKQLWSDREEGEKVGCYVCNTDKEEVAFVLERLRHHHYKKQIPLSECVIFYRTHFQSRVFEDALLKAKIPYIIIGGISFYMRREIKDVLAFLKIASEGADFLSFARTINLPKRGIGPTTQAKIRAVTKGSLIQGCKEILQGSTSLKLSQNQKEALEDYLEIIDSLIHLIRQQAPISSLLEEIIAQTDYFTLLKEDPETAIERAENIKELLSKAVEWQEENPGAPLSAFLEELSLKANIDSASKEQDCLRLMTLHNSKGLEFTAAFLVGMEEELFPHANSLGKSEALEEERRLCYVGMTRARDHLYLSAARSRYLWGIQRFMTASRFLSEIPENYLKKYFPTNEAINTAYKENSFFEVGDHVAHRDFGKGIVQKVYTTSLGATYDVFFTELQATRSLVAQYAKLAKEREI